MWTHTLNFELTESYAVIAAPSKASNEWCDEFYFSGEAKQCGGFLCGGRGNCSLGGNVSEQHLPPSVIISSLVYIVAVVGTQHDLAHVLVPVLEKNSDSWGCCLDRRQVNACDLKFLIGVEYLFQRKIINYFLFQEYGLSCRQTMKMRRYNSYLSENKIVTDSASVKPASLMLFQLK